MTYMRDFHAVLVRCGLSPAPYDKWIEHYRENTELWPLRSGDRLIGGILFHGNHVHIAVEPEWHGRWISKQIRRAYDTWDHPGEVIAAIPKNNRKAIGFARHAGFTYRCDEQGYAIYVKEPRAHKEESCPQSLSLQS